MLKLLNKHLNILYQTVLEPSLWDVFLSELTHDIGGKFAKFSIDLQGEGKSIPVSTVGFEENAMEEYSQYYFDKDIWAEAHSNAGTDQFIPSGHLVDFSTFKKTEIFNDFTKPLDIYHAVGAIVGADEGMEVRVVVQRGKSQGEFGRDVIEYLNVLRPHITRALQLSKKIDLRQLITRALETTLEGDNRCVLIFDENAKLLYHNEAAENLFQTESVIFLKSKMLGFKEVEAQRAFREMLFQLANSSDKLSLKEEIIEVYIAEKNTCYKFFLSPINGTTSIVRAFLGGMNYMIIGREVPVLPNIDEYLKSVFALTPKEIQVAIALSRGDSITDISDHSHRSIHTVRTQVKAVLKKLKLKSQNNLIVFINGLIG